LTSIQDFSVTDVLALAPLPLTVKDRALNPYFGADSGAKKGYFKSCPYPLGGLFQEKGFKER